MNSGSRKTLSAAGLRPDGQVCVPTIAVASTFTAELLQDVLQLWLNDLECPAEIAFAPYNSVFQELLASSSLLSTNPAGMNVVLVRLEDWLADGPVANEPRPAHQQAELAGRIDELLVALESATRTSSVPFVVMLCPGSAAFNCQIPEAAALSSECDRRLGQISNVTVLTSEVMSGLYPEAVVPADADGHGAIPYPPLFFAALGSMLARTFHAMYATAAKVLVLDADYTLWRGECASDDPLAVSVDPEHLALQVFALKQREDGMLLCLVSKNDEADAIRVLDHHPDMRLRRGHFAASRINWRPKSENIRDLAREIGVDLESFVVLDDNSIECAEILAECPSARVLTLPRDPDAMPRFLRHLWPLDKVTVTSEDRVRTEAYAIEIERRRAREHAPSLAEFLESLRLTVTIQPPTVAQMARAAQLTQRTNQFNTTTIRRTAPELRELTGLSDHRCWVVDAADRFGDYGCVGLVIAQLRGTAVEVESLLLSCRALGRGIEHRVVAHLGREAENAGASQLTFRFRRTSRNQPAFEFFERIADSSTTLSSGEMLFSLSAATASTLQLATGRDAAATAAAERVPGRSASPSSGWRRPQLTSQIANEIAWGLREPSDLIRRHAVSVVRLRSLGTPLTEPRTALERLLADAWRRHAAVREVGIDDNFFALGGSSLQATVLVNELQSRADHTFQTVIVFEHPTVSSLAAYLESHEPHAAHALVQSVRSVAAAPLIDAVSRSGSESIGAIAGVHAYPIENLEDWSDADVDRLFDLLKVGAGKSQS